MQCKCNWLITMPMFREQIFGFISFSRDYFLSSALYCVYISPGLISLTSQYLHSPRMSGQSMESYQVWVETLSQATRCKAYFSSWRSGFSWSSQHPAVSLAWCLGSSSSPTSSSLNHFTNPGTFSRHFLYSLPWQGRVLENWLSLKANSYVLAKYLDFMESYFWQEAADFMSRLIFPYFISSSGTDTFFFFLIFYQALIGKSPTR